MTAKKLLTVFLLVLAVSVLLTVTVSAAEPEGGITLSSGEDIIALLTDTLGMTSEIVVLLVTAIGFLEAFFGYTLFRLEIFLGGLAGGAFLGKFLAEGPLASFLPEGAVSCIPMLICGVIGAILAFKLFKLVVFLGFGFAGFTAVKSLAASFALPAPIDMVVAAVVGIILGVLAIKFLRPFVILVTSLAGGILISSAISSLISIKYIDLILLVLIFLLGLLTQRKRIKRKR